ncbi:MAG TPA: trypsin-like peptidase domain-containing protein [Polyangiales bacterium]|nr:trypsin-like peptidase domain-containing protein [Polyangiales bacterium]
MMRFGSTRPALAALLLAACAEELPNADPPELFDLDRAPKVMQEAAKAVVRVSHPAGTSGTGSFISPDGLLLTNAHVLGGETCAREGCEIALTFQHQRGTLNLPARTVYAVPQHVDIGLDMAALQIFVDEAKTQRLPSPYFLTIEPHTALELLGQHVNAIGHPLGRLKKWSSGVVIDAEGEWFDTSIFSLPGSSGSPILNDAGLLVGLLHRGAQGVDLITRTSTQVTAIASASADLQRGLTAPLPSTIVSLAAPLSADEALSHADAFLAASTWKANVDGQPLSLAWLMGTDCDEALARDDFDSVEELQSALSPCFKALSFLECRTDVYEQTRSRPRECPTDERATWQRRLQAAFDKQLLLNGSLDLSAVSFSLEPLADTQAAAEQTARTNLLATLDRVEPRLDFSIASYLIAYNVFTYDNQDLRDVILGYAKAPFYERNAWEITTSAFWLYAADRLSREQTLTIAKDLYRDGKVTLGARLRIEDLLYGSDEL